jgi:ribosome-associated protein
MAQDDLRVGDRFTIDGAELVWTFDASGGPGGQHANKAATRVELRFDVAASPSVPDSLRTLILERLGPRADGGTIAVTVDDSRSQWRNRKLARRRLSEMLEEASRPPKVRRRTKPSQAARRRRLERKRRRGRLKKLRREPEVEE